MGRLRKSLKPRKTRGRKITTRPRKTRGRKSRDRKGGVGELEALKKQLNDRDLEIIERTIYNNLSKQLPEDDQIDLKAILKVILILRHEVFGVERSYLIDKL